MARRTPAPQDQRRRGVVGLLLSMTVLGVFPLDVLLPSFPALGEHFRVEPGDIAFSISLFAVGIAVSQLLIGPLSDSLGRKRLLLAGLLVAMIGALGCVLSTEYAGFLLFRLIQALGCGCFVLSQALVQDLFEGRERERLRILMVTASGLFISLSPLAGSVLQAWLDWPGSFLVFIALALAVLLNACRLLEHPPVQATTSPANLFQAYRRLCGDCNFIAWWLIAALAFACHFAFIVVSPLLLMGHLGLTTYAFSLILLAYGAAYMGGGLLAALLARRVQADTQIMLGLGLIFLSGAVMLYLSQHGGLSALTVLLPMIICTAGTTLVRPAATSKAMDLFSDNAGAAAAAGNTLVLLVGGLISALINLAGANLYVSLAVCFIVLSLIALALNALTRRHATGLLRD
ncbi:MFS transporter, DHA1 family, bicyclomycin/chloramphenicol resistance protein [Pseudomonas sp. ok272]|uniref:MFS transporter n=1 Tax=unclassified Pseudomonas TaxID=196821 RepID=UPI0008C6199B|nr:MULTISPECIES: MFS transporter [unclassified Pseudomonas]SEM82081.1 MFS transporter, DHA1 family, bicyclomycin/chloramphenicol resistance protein [Pseudomonas sp. ok272]SFM66386.1 MFS transporter, DHA1 family, bicyclomycin/chloramphenicol resistance protein [Pseudomonas sp. ok602]